MLNRGFTWLDTGTFDSLLEASNFISLIQNKQNTIIACPEEIAFTNGWIKKIDLLKISKSMKNSYSRHLQAILKI
jgi:glucose-1-phosphate thymidylyltransferase